MLFKTDDSSALYSGRGLRWYAFIIFPTNSDIVNFDGSTDSSGAGKNLFRRRGEIIEFESFFGLDIWGEKGQKIIAHGMARLLVHGA